MVGLAADCASCRSFSSLAWLGIGDGGYNGLPSSEVASGFRACACSPRPADTITAHRLITTTRIIETPLG